MAAKPLIIINFKAYPAALGKRGFSLAKKLVDVGVVFKKYQLAIAPTLLTAGYLAQNISLPIFAQHADGNVGHRTGFVSAAELALLGVKGVILNHSEHKLAFSLLQKTLEECQRANLITIICASTIPEVKKIALLHPHFIAYEPDELIGGNISVTSAHPGLIKQAAKDISAISPTTQLICGAGIQSSEDLKKALSLGAHGVLAAHAIVQAKDPAMALRKLMD